MNELPPGQQLVAGDKWPLVGERSSGPRPPVWTLEVRGLVRRPLDLTMVELQSLPVTRRVVDIHCVTRWSKLGVEFTGVLLRDVLLEVGLLERARYVSFLACSERQHSSSLSVATALELETLLAWEVDGQPLPDQHGGPLRNIVPGRYFYKSVKWLRGLELLEQDRLGYWEADAGYHNLADPWLEQRYLAPDIDKRRARQLMETRDFAGLDLRGLQAAGLELNDLQAAGSRLRDADFRRCQLRRANFRGANLSNAHLEESDLSGACFVGADVEGANFCGANLQGCDFQGASLFGASFVAEDWQALEPAARRAAHLADVQLTTAQVESLATRQIDFFRHMGLFDRR